MASYRSSNQAAESWGQNHHHVHSASESMKDDKSSSKFSSAMSFWSRKSLKRSNTTHSTSLVVLPPVLSPATDAPPSLPVGSADDGKLFPNTFGARLSYSKSFAPESTNPNDMLSVDDPLAAIPDPACKVKYHIHNPLGPRWYKNHHLIPPSQIKPSMRPPTFFSTSFPPISTSSMPENIGESANPSMGASNSPLPTPTSSQTRVGEGIKPRSRKTSQTTPDNVDLLDVTDPWGTNWHHESPYDIGAPTSNKVEPEELGRRLRRASMTAAQNSFKAVAPSPLSQSTSAVHLHDLVPEKPPTPAANTISPSAIQLPRKLSKRKPTDLNGLFRPPTKDEERKAVSAPPTPVERICLTDSTSPEPGSLPKRMSVAPPVSYGYTPQISPTKKEKRGSVLGRIVKKFSLLRRSGDDFGKADSREYSWLHVNPDDARSPSMRPSVDLYNRQPSPEKQEPVKRVPAPSIAPQPTSPSSPEKEKDYSPPPPPPSAPQEDRSSYISLDAPFSIGKLTIANPDTPESEKGSPALQSIPLSPEPSPPTTRLATPEFKPLKPAPSPSPSPALHPPKIPARENSLSHAYDKPLPIPAPSTVASSIGGSSPLPESRQQLEPQLPNGSRPTRTGTVSSIATYKPGVPIPVQDIQPSADPDSDSDSSSSDSDSSSSEDEASSVSNRPIAPESTVEASTVSKAPTLPEKPAVVPTPPPPVVPPTPSPPPAASRDTTPKAKEGRTSRTNSVQRLSKAPEIPPLSLSLANGSAAGVYPIAMSFTPEELTTQDRINSFLSGAESPYSATSVLVNPPTPYHDRSTLLPNPETPAVAPPPLPAKPPPKETTRRSSRDPSPGQPTRQTETFKLVRNHSGNPYMSTETIVAAGQQWEVVGTEKPKNRSSSKKDKDHHRENTRKESGSSSRHNNNNGVKVEESDPYARSHQRHSKQVSSSSQQLEVSTVPMPSKTVNGKRSSSYRYEDGHEHRRYEEPQQIMSPRSGEDSSSSKHREDRRKSDYRRSREEMRGSISKDDYRRIEEQRRREERRRYEEEKRYEEERQMEKERRRRERHEKERERELRERERELERERERLERERQLELEKEREREREVERQRELARERELLEREREREREKERELEKERQREQKRREREKEKEKERQRESERQRIRELERELEKEREKAKEREEREKERQRERRRREREERRQQEEKAKERSREENKRRSPDDSKHRRKRDDRKSEDERKNRATVYLTPEHSRVESYYSNGSQSMYIPQSSEGRVERRPSTATRPTSELPSTADLNALRAKEAWDMERMWKARSMYGTELNGNAVQAIPAQSVLSFSDNLSTQGATYGSSHTAFMLQTPFQAPGSSIYHSMPTKPPPIIYGSPASIPSLPDSLPYDPYDNNNIGPTPPRPIRKSGVGSSPPDGLPAPTLLRRQPLVENPLPEPPRESTFQPSALGHLNPSTVDTGDYWSKYAGVTIAH